MADSNGVASSRYGRRARPILSLKSVEQALDICSQVPADEPLSDSIGGPLDQFEAALWAERNRWDIERRILTDHTEAWLRGGGFAGRGKLSKDDADRLLKRGIAAVGGAQ